MIFNFFYIHLFPEFLLASGPLTWWCASTLGAALLCSSRVGSWFGAYIQTCVEGFITLHHKGICIQSYQTWWSSVTNIWNKYPVYFEAKSHWIQAGIEPVTFWSWVACSAIWATMLRLTNCVITTESIKKNSNWTRVLSFIVEF